VEETESINYLPNYVTLYNSLGFLYPDDTMTDIEYIKLTINGKIYSIVENYKFTQLNEKIFLDENGYISIENFSISTRLKDLALVLFFTKNTDVNDPQITYTMPKEILDICNNDMSTLDDDKKAQIKNELGLFVSKSNNESVPYFWYFEPTELETTYNIHVKPNIDAKYLIPSFENS